MIFGVSISACLKGNQSGFLHERHDFDEPHDYYKVWNSLLSSYKNKTQSVSNEYMGKVGLIYYSCSYRKSPPLLFPFLKYTEGIFLLLK